MSNQVNTNLLETAYFHISYWEGEGIGAVLEADIARSDLEALYNHIKESQTLMFEAEYEP